MNCYKKSNQNIKQKINSLKNKKLSLNTKSFKVIASNEVHEIHATNFLLRSHATYKHMEAESRGEKDLQSSRKVQFSLDLPLKISKKPYSILKR